MQCQSQILSTWIIASGFTNVYGGLKAANFWNYDRSYGESDN